MTLTIDEILSKSPWPHEKDVIAGDSSYAGFLNFNALSGLGKLGQLASGNLRIAPWWSRQRDIQLRHFWKQQDHLAGAVYAMQAKMTAIPFDIIPVFPNIKKHRQEADWYREALMVNSQDHRGWDESYSRMLIDLLTQDNGGFNLIYADGRWDQPILGPTFGVKQLDSARCLRTSNPEFPVLYEHPNGSRYKLHYDRVQIFATMPDPRIEMLGVQMCSVSRAIRNAYRLSDVFTYAEEKMGTRPPRGILSIDGISKEKLEIAIRAFNQSMDSEGLSFFSRLMILASLDRDVKVNLTDLSRLPDGFDEEKTTVGAMYAIALAFGVDARELWPATASGATKADATIQHQKARGKAPGHIMRIVEHQMNMKVLPPYLKFKFDYQDDEQDNFRADIRKKQSEAIKVDIESGVRDVRSGRESMLNNGAIRKADFARMELADGRLPDGTSVLALFFSEINRMKGFLDLGVKNPLHIEENNPQEMAMKIRDKESELNVILVNTTSPEIKDEAQQALAALKALRAHYAPGQPSPLQPPDSTDQGLNLGDELTNTEDVTVTTSQGDSIDNDQDENGEFNPANNFRKD
jgi:hypothetical protein